MRNQSRINPDGSVPHECQAWSPAGQLLAVERARILRDCLGELTGYQMLILVMRYEDDRTCEEIAEELGVEESAVWKMLERIHRVLLGQLAHRKIVALSQIL